MKLLYFCAAALLIAATSSAYAQAPPRLDDGEYLAASRCVALNNARQLQDDGYNVEGLERVVRRHYSPVANAVADSQAEAIRREARRAGDDAEKIAELRVRRDATCANFVSSGLVQAPSAPSAS